MWPELEAFIPIRQRNNTFVNNWQGRGVSTRGIKQWKINRVCSYSLMGPKFSVSGGKDAFYPPLQQAPFTWVIYLLLLGDKGDSEYFSCTGCFSNMFDSKLSIFQNGVCGGDIFWTPAVRTMQSCLRLLSNNTWKGKFFSTTLAFWSSLVDESWWSRQMMPSPGIPNWAKDLTFH